MVAAFGAPEAVRYFGFMASKTKSQHGGPRAGSGRPPLPLGKRRRHRLVVNLTDSEFRALRDLAGEMPLATYLRRLVVRHVARRKK